MMKKIELLRNRKKGEIYFYDIPSIIVNRSDQVSVQVEIERMIGPTAKTIVYKASKKSSLNRFHITVEKLIEKDRGISKKDQIEEVFKHLQTMGYGLFTLSKFSDKDAKFKVSVENSFNTFGYLYTLVPVCHILSGTLAGIFEVITQRGMDCKEVSCSAMEGGHGVCEFVIKENNQKMHKRNIVVPHYLRQVTESEKGLMEKFTVDYDEKKGEIYYNGVNSMIIARDVYATEYREFSRIIGPATRSLVYKAHKSEGYHALSTEKKFLVPLIRLFNQKLLANNLLEEVWRRGFGVPELIEFNDKEKSLVIRIKNSFNALGYEGRNMRDYTVCYFLIGVIAGGSELLFNDSSVFCYETKCIGKGDKYCEFVVKKHVSRNAKSG